MRRSISTLVVIFASALLAALSQRPSSPRTQAARIRSGPMLGYADLTEASVWIQTTAPADVRLRYWPEGRRGEARTTPSLSASEQTDDTALFVVPGLEPGSRYSYEVLVAGAPAAFPAGGATGILTTQPLWQWRRNPPDFTVAFGSCYYANEPKADRPGTPYGSDPGIFRTIAGMKPDVMIWLGDNIYYREVDFGSVAAMRRRNAIGREEPALQPLLAASHHYAVWDDHDFGPNDSTWIFSHWRESFDIFKTYWANPTYGARGVEGVFGQFGWGDVDFFLLDDRMYRTPERVAETPDKTMLGRDQLRWLEHSLSYSAAPFKVVVNGSQMLNSNSHGESFAHYVTEQKELLDWTRLLSPVRLHVFAVHRGPVGRAGRSEQPAPRFRHVPRQRQAQLRTSPVSRRVQRPHARHAALRRDRESAVDLHRARERSGAAGPGWRRAAEIPRAPGLRESQNLEDQSDRNRDWVRGVRFANGGQRFQTGA